MIGGNFAQFFEKVAKTDTKPINTKISTLKQNLKVQNMYIKLKNDFNRPFFETAHLGENVKN